MEPWTAWADTKALAFLHARVRDLLLRQGVEESYLHLDGRPVHVYAAGPRDAKRTVVLLHGLGDSANNWFRTLPLLAWRGDRVLAIDLPGHGLSPPPERGYLHIREHADVVQRVVREVGANEGGDLALVGHSLGGWVAARSALTWAGPAEGRPASHLVLVESAGLAYEGMWDSIEMLRIEHEEDVKRFFRIVTHKVPFGFNLVAREVAQMFRSPAVVNFINGYDRDDVIEDADLASVTARTTIVWGEEDGLIPPILAHRWHAAIPGSTLVWIPKCGHAPQFERPLLFHALVEEALGHAPLHHEVGARLKSGFAKRMPEPVRRRFSWA